MSYGEFFFQPFNIRNFQIPLVPVKIENIVTFPILCYVVNGSILKLQFDFKCFSSFAIILR